MEYIWGGKQLTKGDKRESMQKKTWFRFLPNKTKLSFSSSDSYVLFASK